MASIIYIFESTDMALIFDPSTDYTMKNLNWLNFKPIYPEINALKKPIETQYSLDDSTAHVPLPAMCRMANAHNYTENMQEQIDILGISGVPLLDTLRYFGPYENLTYNINNSQQTAIQMAPNTSVPTQPSIKYLRVDTTDLLYQRSDKRIFSTNIHLKSITPAQRDSAIAIAQFFETVGYGLKKHYQFTSAKQPFVHNPPPMWAVWVNSGPAPSATGYHSNFFLRLNHAFLINCTTQTQGEGQDTPYSIYGDDEVNSGPLIVTIQLAFSEIQSAYRSDNNTLQNRSSL